MAHWDGLTLKGFREAAGLSRRELMFRLRDLGGDTTPAERTIQRWEDGLTAPDADDIAALAAVLGCEVQDLFSAPKEGAIA
jgi:transcriptional regulator with XRE-family HTH domain